MIYWVLRTIVGLVFVAAGVLKSTSYFNPALSSNTIWEGFQLQNPTFSKILVACEFVLGAWLLIGVFRQTAATTAVALLAIFCGSLLHELSKPTPRACGCFGSAKVFAGFSPSATIAISFAINIALIVMLVPSLELRRKSRG
jgi:uncharacterized membrane protein YphA (DoxX/SURF4 family)